MHDVLVIFCQDSVIIFASAKKINYLKQVDQQIGTIYVFVYNIYV